MQWLLFEIAVADSHMHHRTAKETTKLIKEIQTSVKQSKDGRHAYIFEKNKVYSIFKFRFLTNIFLKFHTAQRNVMLPSRLITQ
jgi:hypothetical protein